MRTQFTQATLTSMCVGLAFWVLARWTVSTPSLNSALTFAGLCAAEWLLIAPAPHLAGLRVDQWAEFITVAVTVVYLIRTRHRHGPDVIAPGHPRHQPGPAAIGAS